MSRKKLVKEKLARIDAGVGDCIQIKKDSNVRKGVLMPHHEFSDSDIINIKLKNGYNIGLKITSDTQIKLIEKKRRIEKKNKKIPYEKEKPDISLIGTGGTIACYVDYRTGAVHPAKSVEELAFSVPEIFEIANIKSRILLRKFSENIEPKDWKMIAEKTAEELNSGSKGVIITHGTDTMGYTAAALSFMLENLNGPVVLVGSQRSSDRPSSDAVQNLISAVELVAKSDLGEVVVVMHGETSDTYTNILRGTKTRKFHTSRRDAFKPINTEPIGKIKNGNIQLTSQYKKAKQGEVKVKNKLETDVAMIYAYPGLKPEDIPEKKGIVLIGTGLGHIPKEILPRIKELSEKGAVFTMTSQCFYGRVNMKVYSTGRDILKTGIIPCYDMLPETAYVKLMHALAYAKDQRGVEKIMKKNIANEMTKRTKTQCFM
ncbi:MAG: Glu-tRNA(Gln) amidotransferase subunit GatD [Candidatus Thermoplasmatota archaeon]